MRASGVLLLLSICLSTKCCVRDAMAQSVAQANPQTGGTPLQKAANASDPLSVGKAAMDHADYPSAKTFFTSYVSENPKDAEAWFYLGGAELGLNHPAEAAKNFLHCIELKPDAWTAHQNLALAYAEQQDWPAFDKERQFIKAARAEKKLGLSMEGHDLIDVLHVGDKRFDVWYFPKLYGHFNARYVFLHWDAKGNADEWVQCESDDVDQGFFAQRHPKEAAAGDRSFSLDSYSKSEKGMSQALHKFYQDGEPTYETVRADVLNVLNAKSKPAATSNTPSKN